LKISDNIKDNFPFSEKLPREIALLLLGSMKDFFTRGGITRAGSLAFTTMISMIPLFGLIVILFKQVGGFEWLMEQTTPLLRAYMSPDGSQMISDFLLEHVAALDLGGLGAYGVVFLGLGVYSLISTVETDFNNIWRVRRSRSVFQRITRYWLLMTLLPTVAALSIFLSSESVLSGMFDAVPAWIGESNGHFLPLVIQFMGFWFLYWALPNTRVQLIPAGIGAAFAAFSWEGAKIAFAAYTSQATGYSLIYGSLAALPLFMLWVYLSWILILLGAELSFAIQNRSALLIKKAYKRSGPMPAYIMAMAVTKFTYAAFRSGGNLEVRKLSRSLALPEADINDVIGVLCDGKVIRRVHDGNDEILIPVKPVEEIDAAEILGLFIRDPDEFRANANTDEMDSIISWMSEKHAKMLAVYHGEKF
jgi:membrane protein